MQIGVTDIAVDGRGYLVLIDAGDQAHIGAGDADEAGGEPGAVGGDGVERPLLLIRTERLLRDSRQKRHFVCRPADRTALILGRRHRDPLAVDQRGGNAGTAREIVHHRRDPVEIDAGKHHGANIAVDGGDRIGGHDDRRREVH